MTECLRHGSAFFATQTIKACAGGAVRIVLDVEWGPVASGGNLLPVGIVEMIK
jgi:hypothetical protein